MGIRLSYQASKHQKMFDNDQYTSKLKNSTSDSKGKTGEDGKCKSSLYFSKFELDDSYHKESILTMADNNIVFGTGLKMSDSRKYTDGDLILTPSKKVFCLKNADDNGHKFRLEYYGKIETMLSREQQILDGISSINIYNIKNKSMEAPCPTTRSMEAYTTETQQHIKIRFEMSCNIDYANSSTNTRYYDFCIIDKNLPCYTKQGQAAYGYSIYSDPECENAYSSFIFNAGRDNIDFYVYFDFVCASTDTNHRMLWRIDWEDDSSSYVYTKAYAHFIDDYVLYLDNSYVEDASIFNYQPSYTMLYNYNKSDDDGNALNSPECYYNEDTSNYYLDSSLYTDYTQACRQLYGIEFKSKITASNEIVSQYDFILRIGLKNDKKYGGEKIEACYLGNTLAETSELMSPYTSNNSITSTFYKNLYIPLNDSSCFLPDMSMDRLHLFDNEYQTNIGNTVLTISGKTIKYFFLSGILYQNIDLNKYIVAGFDYASNPLIENIHRQNIFAFFSLNDTFFNNHYRLFFPTANIPNILNSYMNGFFCTHSLIQYPIRYIENELSINYRGGESAYFSSIVPNKSTRVNDTRWDNGDRFWFPINRLYFNTLKDSSLLNNFDDYVKISHLTNPNNRSTVTEQNKVKMMANDSILPIVGSKIYDFVFDDNNEYELICIEKNTRKTFYIDLKRANISIIKNSTQQNNIGERF